MTRELWKGGIPLMAVSDSPEWFLVTGFSIHDEIAMFVESGLTPYAALQTATIVPASYLGFGDQKGTIEKGKRADLLLLDQNPLDNIENTRRIIGVMKAGKWYDRTEINSMITEAKILGK